MNKINYVCCVHLDHCYWWNEKHYLRLDPDDAMKLNDQTSYASVSRGKKKLMGVYDSVGQAVRRNEHLNKAWKNSEHGRIMLMKVATLSPKTVEGVLVVNEISVDSAGRSIQRRVK